MEYLYDALKREIGAEDSDPVLPGVEPRDASAPAVLHMEPTAVVPAEGGRAVPFPVNTDRLYAFRIEDMCKERVHSLEQYRVLRSRVLEIMRAQKMRTLMVTSAVSGECKTTTSINLALALSQVQGLRVLLVDTDLRKAGISEVLGVPYEMGLQDCLRTPVPLSSMLLKLTNSLSFIPSGGVDQDSAELLHSDKMVSIVNDIKRDFDIAIFDTPPLFPVADSRVIANLMDAVLFCVRAGATAESTISEAVALVRPKLIGTVLAGAEIRSGGWYYYSVSHGKE